MHQHFFHTATPTLTLSSNDSLFAYVYLDPADLPSGLMLAQAVKQYARQHPHSMGEWSSDSKSHVSTMSAEDFRSTERSHTVERAGTVRTKVTLA